jgi:membrane associated rhomboid family serine protease
VLSLIPISDTNPARRTPVVTIGLIILNVIAFFRTPDLGTGFAGTKYFVTNAPIPCQLQDTCPAALGFGPGFPAVDIPVRGLGSFVGAILFSTFLHAGLLHLLGNMLFLWIFGNNVEDHLGHVRYLLFYLAGGLAAGFAHVFISLDEVIPSVGASGAVAAVMGAYILLYPRARVNVLVPFFFIFTIVQLSAIVVLGIWFVYQFLIGAQELTRGATEVAWMAHVGGFVFGAVAIFLLGGRPQPRQPQWSSEWRY